MSAWTDGYRGKVVGVDEALAGVRSGQRVYIHPGAAEPEGLVRALVRRAGSLRDVEIIHLLTLGEAGYVKPGMEASFRHTAMFVGGNVREAVREGRADYLPVSLSEIPALFTSGLLPIDVCLIQVSPPDPHGFCSFGVGVDCTKAAAAVARTVIAEVNPRMPRTLGDSFIHVSKLDRIVESDAPILELPHRPIEEVHRRIAAHVASLVEDGSTLQLGIGGIPDAVLSGLSDRRHLGIHTEMFSDGVMELIEAGVITNERKTFHRGKVVSGFLLGSTKLYEFVDNNAMIELHPTEYTNDPFVIAANEKMVAVNSALQVDLTGQVCADSMGTSIYSGVGGQLDFMRGAARSKGGKPIIALPSTAKNDTLTRIVPTLDSGAGVVTTRADVHYVVTEYGVASLHGRTLRQRAEALIAIAHPDFREQLLAFAITHRYLDRPAGSPALVAD
ncbi:MAG TPA: acetyl-CoA hydrolase/transferase C-terminal domain-containing protein [Candidatus Polarisedimenticolaceae bacterium]|nr:acetyl-CoA hydrolase/transferase C-terminal domain-containing protein [Candidatus Polarisedimenticolaceae bacterium]